MALCHNEYPPFLGTTSIPQGYDCAHYGAPLYQCVFPVPDDICADDLADEVLQYQHELRTSAPTMCLTFAGRGVVWPDQHKKRTNLIKAIEFVQHLPCMIGDANLSHWDGDHIRSFMGKGAKRPHIMRESMAIYDIDTGLSGRQMAGEARRHFKHLQKKNIEMMILRFPNGGSVMVHHYVRKGFNELHLCTAIQRARKMDLSEHLVSIPAAA